MSTLCRSPLVPREWSSMLLTMPSARRPCSAILSRLPVSMARVSSISARVTSSSIVERRRRRRLQLVEQFDREPGEVVDEIERVLDLVGDPGGQLAERGHLLGVDQARLRRLQFAQRRLGGIPRRPQSRRSSRAFSIAITACAAKFCNSSICFSENAAPPGARTQSRRSTRPLRSSGTPSMVSTTDPWVRFGFLNRVGPASKICTVRRSRAARPTKCRRRGGCEFPLMGSYSGATSARASTVIPPMCRSPNAAPHKRIAFSTTVSKTGARSTGEQLMTRKTSVMAVCCSKASRVSVISRAFSIAITACAAKFCKCNLLVGERPNLLAIDVN